jgi:hypothetical protein
MEREAWNGAQEWMEENLELHGVDELWIQAERHQGLLLLHKQLLSAYFPKETTCTVGKVKKRIGSAPGYTTPLFDGFT